MMEHMKGVKLVNAEHMVPKTDTEQELPWSFRHLPAKHPGGETLSKHLIQILIWPLFPGQTLGQSSAEGFFSLVIPRVFGN